jgi:alpha-tubulin suppressor-like RCC1 family protein
LRTGGSLWCWGSNVSGELGVGKAVTGTAGIATTPQQVGPDREWLAVDAALHTCALAADGSLWCWGPNSNGVLGPTSTGSDVPTRFGADNDWVAISLDGGRTCGLRKDGSLWCWGYNLSSEPAQIGDALDWRTASARFGAFCGIKNDGSLWCGNLQSALARLGSATDWVEATPPCGVRASGALVCGLAVGMEIPIDTAIDWMTAGTTDTIRCAVKKSGTLWCMGAGQNGEMGHGDAWRTTPVRALMTP